MTGICPNRPQGRLLWTTPGGCPTHPENCPNEPGGCPNSRRVVHRGKQAMARVAGRFRRFRPGTEKKKRLKKPRVAARREDKKCRPTACVITSCTTAPYGGRLFAGRDLRSKVNYKEGFALAPSRALHPIRCPEEGARPPNARFSTVEGLQRLLARFSEVV